MQTPLQVKVEGQKELNQIIMNTLAAILPALGAFLGKKICKADDTLVKVAESIKDLIPKGTHPDNSEFPLAYISCRGTAMFINFRICKSGGSYDVTPSTAYSEYFLREIYIADVPNTELELVKDYDEIISAYGLDKVIDVEAEEAKVKEYEIMKKKLDDLYYSINPIFKDFYYLKGTR